MIALFLGSLALFGAFLCWLDQPTHPAWRVRNAYRWLCWWLVVALGIVTVKALLYRQELRFQIQTCQER